MMPARERPAPADPPAPESLLVLCVRLGSGRDLHREDSIAGCRLCGGWCWLDHGMGEVAEDLGLPVVAVCHACLAG